MTVTGLQPDERYVFAVAAYTTEGKLIGDGVGETSKPVLASHCLPVLMTWAFISQVRLTTDNFITTSSNETDLAGQVLKKFYPLKYFSFPYSLKTL